MSQLHSVDSSSESLSLRERWRALRQAQPRARARDAAEQFGVSEAELLASGVGDDVVRLDNRVGEILSRLESLGPVMALTRNESAVHEKRGVYQQLELHSSRALFLGEDIDLRLFLSHWRFAFASQEGGASNGKRSLQFFDDTGTAIHKVFLEEDSHVAAFERLVAEFASGEQSPLLPVVRREPPAPPRPDITVDVQGLRGAWLALRDTHEFFGMLQRFEVARVQALRLVGADLALPVEPGALTWVLEQAAASQVPIMVFVGNRGAIQIHTGPVQKVRPTGPWMNVLDHGFNLHVRADHIATAWIVRKPTIDGVVTSVELFDSAGETIALLFGKRKPGQPEAPAWRALTEQLTRALPLPEESP
ncbi:hemin-degrading factor [Hyalangium gracile]|uniref:hemin-degrading factor n=1 Tax=Hyalangium gracile TaxID=394092 RepID=UPI001CCD726F|nr:ChuX/HutX family heme-like substrate-binding protein [Hyalangium gracile]